MAVQFQYVPPKNDDMIHTPQIFVHIQHIEHTAGVPKFAIEFNKLQNPPDSHESDQKLHLGQFRDLLPTAYSII